MNNTEIFNVFLNNLHRRKMFKKMMKKYVRNDEKFF